MVYHCTWLQVTGVGPIVSMPIVNVVAYKSTTNKKYNESHDQKPEYCTTWSDGYAIVDKQQK